MKLYDLIDGTGIRIVEGGPFPYEDFGPSWVLGWDDGLTAVFHIESKEIIFVEAHDLETRQDCYTWLNPAYGDMQKNNVYEELADVKTHYVETLQEVFNVWHKNQDMYIEAVEGMKTEYVEDEQGK